jgi:peptidoglycan/xylan/chitin deacetylase (PgdA/CDA1 family)
VTPIRALPVLACLLALVAGCASVPPTQTAPAPSGSSVSDGGRQPSASPGETSASPTASASPSPTATEPAAVNCRKVKCVALTFDDGPGPQTGTLLDTLIKEKVPATFFLVGNMVKNEQKMAKRIAQTPGMTLGNHTMSHPNLRLIGITKATKEMTENTKLIKQVTGVQVRYLRPPYGSHNSATDAVAKKLGQAVVNWSAGALDWQYNTADKVIAATMPQLAPGAIVLAHDIHPWTIKAVPTLIKKIRAKGYTLVSLDDILGTTSPGKTYARGLHP